MDDRGAVAFAFPRPRRALTIVLITIAVLGIVNAFLLNWIPELRDVFLSLTCDLGEVSHGQIWRLLSSGLLTRPDSYSHLVFTLLGLYFLGADLEKTWGSWRFLRFLGTSVVVGNLLVLLVDLVAPI